VVSCVVDSWLRALVALRARALCEDLLCVEFGRRGRPEY